ncbi:hypothetical protein CpB0395 [Chlamydia pneumoniae TW-183]|uniref:DNA-directed DNA polymerase n=3 Tax=Chlamydia pneumoniae TaxID=83558 RepID=Q9Z8G0_CHLPN|nr:DNA polymerase III subunit delta [Chlamydia pneumoniae]AAD18527.1 CT047 hypothetical protein [Chlamydia pneumoniae CWL029]AAF38221.1 conserved hypothetical protein [Chlamydia pneumoniae AR39]AAP98326.1 hypothetical protein CpB0395 [Chlamydia pneumoniae TW-183]BAA98591.1 CT047 hypothetical protein [Chlamydia pneumoniae J138]
MTLPMQKSLTSFDDFSQAYAEKVPAIALIGSALEDDKDALIELLVSESFKELGGQGLMPATLMSWTETFALFQEHETLGIIHAEKFPLATKEFLSRYARNPQPHLTILIFTTKQECFRELSKALPSALSLSLFGEWPADRQKRIIRLLLQRAERVGISCSQSLASLFLRALASTSLPDILSEFDKLLCSVGKKTSLDHSDIKELVVKKEKASLWKFRDSLLKRDPVEGHQQLHFLLEDGEDPLGIITFLRTQCLYGLRSIEEGSKENKHRMFVLYGKERLHQALNSLFYAETLIKNNVQDPIVAVETLVIRMVNL